MSETTELALPLLLPAQAQKHVTVNEALTRLDALVQARVQARDLALPPPVAEEGAVWIVAGPVAGGAWEGWEGDLALRSGGGWVRIEPGPGWIVWSLAEAALLVRGAAGWTPLTEALALLDTAALADGSLPRLGVGAAADATNGFVFQGTNLLLQSAGSIDATFNRTGAANDASFSFKTGYAPRALLGLLGNDDFTLKMGEGFVEAMRVNHRSGRAVFRRVQNGARPFDAVGRRHVAESAWAGSTSAADNDWRGIAWAPEIALFAAVGDTGTGNRVMTSPDGVAWTARTSAANNAWQAVCWSGERGLFVAVASSGTGNRVMTSPDGITWTVRTSAADNAWSSVAWAAEPGLFVAVAGSGAGNRVMTSPDGIVWTARTSAADNAWSAVAWAAELGLFVAVAGSGTGDRVMTSPDGIVWTAGASAADLDWRSVCWSAEVGLLVAVAASGAGDRVMTSPDGIVWALRSSATANDWRAVAWAPEIGLFAAVASSGTGNRAMTSADGMTWTSRASAANVGWRGLAWAGELGLFAAVSATGTGNRAMTTLSSRAFPYRG
jgi:hypothetical protein